MWTVCTCSLRSFSVIQFKKENIYNTSHRIYNLHVVINIRRLVLHFCILILSLSLVLSFSPFFFLYHSLPFSLISSSLLRFFIFHCPSQMSPRFPYLWKRWFNDATDGRTFLFLHSTHTPPPFTINKNMIPPLPDPHFSGFSRKKTQFESFLY